jgi:hypothetical protein
VVCESCKLGIGLFAGPKSGRGTRHLMKLESHSRSLHGLSIFVSSYLATLPRIFALLSHAWGQSATGIRLDYSPTASRRSDCCLNLVGAPNWNVEEAAPSLATDSLLRPTALLAHQQNCHLPQLATFPVWSFFVPTIVSPFISAN